MIWICRGVFCIATHSVSSRNTQNTFTSHTVSLQTAPRRNGPHTMLLLVTQRVNTRHTCDRRRQAMLVLAVNSVITGPTQCHYRPHSISLLATGHTQCHYRPHNISLLATGHTQCHYRPHTVSLQATHNVATGHTQCHYRPHTISLLATGHTQYLYRSPYDCRPSIFYVVWFFIKVNVSTNNSIEYLVLLLNIKVMKIFKSILECAYLEYCCQLKRHGDPECLSQYHTSSNQFIITLHLGQYRETK